MCSEMPPFGATAFNPSISEFMLTFKKRIPGLFQDFSRTFQGLLRDFSRTLSAEMFTKKMNNDAVAVPISQEILC